MQLFRKLESYILAVNICGKLWANFLPNYSAKVLNKLTFPLFVKKKKKAKPKPTKTTNNNKKPNKPANQ